MHCIRFSLILCTVCCPLNLSLNDIVCASRSGPYNKLISPPQLQQTQELRIVISSDHWHGWQNEVHHFDPIACLRSCRHSGQTLSVVCIIYTLPCLSPRTSKTELCCTLKQWVSWSVYVSIYRPSAHQSTRCLLCTHS